MMKKTFSLLLTLVLLAFPIFSLADESEAVLTVQGTATVTLEADWAQITLGVITTAETVDAAAADNAAHIQQVITALTEAGMDTADMATDSYAVTALYDYQYGKITEQQVITGYQVSNLLRLSIHDITKMGDMLDTAMKAGANECYGITFQSSKGAIANDQALEMAIAEGTRKAGIMAKASGKELGHLISLTEESGSYAGVTMNADAGTETAFSTTIMADGLTFSATVTMTYSLH